jgi:outer membrane protein OmpA-like peptidoglycan-associated protein/tetratricopeptide (TPR) repeat protein
MKRLILLIISFVPLWVFGQEQLTKRQQADKLFERYEYAKSLNLYLEIEGTQKYELSLIEHIATCFREMSQYEQAEKWYSDVVADEKADPVNTYYYAEVLLRNKNFEAAKNMYKAYYSKTGKADELAFKLATCDSAALWINEPSGYAVKNEQSLNSSYSEWGLTYYGNTAFIFTSDRKTTVSKNEKYTYPWTGNGYFKLFQAEGTKLIELPIDFKHTKLLTGDYHVGPIALNATEDTAYITITTVISKKEISTEKKLTPNKQKLYTRRLQLIIATKKDGQWGNFKSFTYNNINQYSIGHAALSHNGKMIYFTSDMNGGFGKTDIWYCEKLSNGTWGKPVNCGKDINTKEEEAFPTINGDDVLYYSSKGLPGMGGYDLFVAHGGKTTWSKPDHLPYPINSTSDDFWYISKDGLTGYFSSDRENGEGNDDIYSFSFKTPKPKKAPKKNPEPDIAGPVAPPKQYETGSSFVLNNIYYDLDKSNIRPDAAVELDKLVMILKEHPTMRIELSSHTDSRAPDAYNMVLSQRRAAAAVAYLVSKGIDKKRMIAKGYGETRLVNKCANEVPCSEAEHQLNRRTEVKILSQ